MNCTEYFACQKEYFFRTRCKNRSHAFPSRPAAAQYYKRLQLPLRRSSATPSENKLTALKEKSPRPRLIAPRSDHMFLALALLRLFYLEYLSEHKSYERRTFYDYDLQANTPLASFHKTTSQHDEKNRHNKGKAALRQHARGYYSRGKRNGAFALCSTTLHRINSFAIIFILLIYYSAFKTLLLLNVYRAGGIILQHRRIIVLTATRDFALCCSRQGAVRFCRRIL